MNFLDVCLILRAFAREPFEETVTLARKYIRDAEMVRDFSHKRLPPQAEMEPYKEPKMFSSNKIIINESSSFDELPMDKQ